MRVIVAGGREVTDILIVIAAIEASGFEITELVSGCAPGVDTLAEEWVRLRALAGYPSIPIKRCPADWDRLKLAAGPIRNREMAEYAEALIAIPTGGPGTKNMLKVARELGLKVFKYTW